MFTKKTKVVILVVFIFTGFLINFLYAESKILIPPVSGSTGQLIYVPVYSHIYVGNREQPVYLAATVSIRNTDFKSSIIINVADYYDSNGKLVKKYIEKPVTIAPMASIRYVIMEDSKVGGSGANFIISWDSKNIATTPLIESIMISTKSQQGISFTSRGMVIKNQ